MSQFSWQLSWHVALATLWIGWAVYWLASASQVKPTRWHEPLVSRLGHIIPLLIAAVLLFSQHAPPRILTGRFLPRSEAIGWLGVAIIALGLALSVWARRHIGANWSSTVTVKEDHALIRSGPYRFVRHPIYSGLLLALAGTAMAFGEWRSLLGLGFALLGLIYKSRTEERAMAETFPAYQDYRRKTAALIPFVY